jgi:transcriptional regulator with XRE-family HTH domain
MRDKCCDETATVRCGDFPRQRTLGDAMKASREQAGLSLQELATAAGLTKAHVWELERGRCTNPTVKTIHGLARALGVKPDIVAIWALADCNQESGTMNPNDTLFPRIIADGEPPNPIPWPDPTPEMLASPEFEAVWQCIKRWDINVPDRYAGYMGANGNHVRAILDALEQVRRR